VRLASRCDSGFRSTTAPTSTIKPTTTSSTTPAPLEDPGIYVDGVCPGNTTYDVHVCQTCRQSCHELQHIEQACTGVERSNRQCTNCSHCLASQYMAGKRCDGLTPIDTQNCTACTESCGATRWISKPGTGWNTSDIECSPCLTQCSPGHHLSKNYTGTDLTLAQCMPCRQCQVGTYRGPSWKPSHHGNLAMAMGSTTRRLTVCRALNVTQGAIRRPLTSPVMEGLS